MRRKKLIKSEVIKIFSTTKETLRHYENLGLIKPEIDENNYRYYDHRELRKLRQILFLREMEMPLDAIVQLENKKVSEDDYIELLNFQYENLKDKVERQIKNLEKTKQLLLLLKGRSYKNSFEIRYLNERYFYRLETTHKSSPPDIKFYLDQFGQLIDKKIYSERSFLILYPFENLLNSQYINGVQCLEIRKDTNLDRSFITTFPESTYLSVFYHYTDGDNESLKELYSEIKRFLKSQKWRISNSTVIEMEHPELSIIYDDNQNIYELQIQVEKI